MNMIDVFVLFLFILFMVGGYYRGFMSTLLSTGAFVGSTILSFLFRPLISNWIHSQQGLFNSLLYYTEGAEFVNNVELSRTAISSISNSQLHEVISSANLPHPMDLRISENIAREAFADRNITTLGDYFNETIVCVCINILAFLLIFLILRAFFAFLIHGVDYARGGYPVLYSADGWIGAGIGIVRAFLALFILFMIAPILETVLPRIGEYINDSFFGPFFYHSNFLLSLIPGV